MWQAFFDSSWFNFLFAGLLFLSVAGGVLLALQFKKKRKWESSGIENAVVAIFGLIISFTFAQAGNAHRERYNYIHQEANAAKLLFQYSREMPDSFRQQTRNFLRSYLENQMGYDKTIDNSEELLLSAASKIGDHYRAYVSLYKIKNSDLLATSRLDKIYNLLDDVTTAFSRHYYSYDERTPASAMLLLSITAILIGFLVGFMNGVKASIHYLVPVIYFVMITLIMIVIRDFNSPLQGFIRPNYHDLKTTYEYVNRN